MTNEQTTGEHALTPEEYKKLTDFKKFLSVTAWGFGCSLVGITYLTFKGLVPLYVGMTLGVIFLGFLLVSVIYYLKKRFEEIEVRLEYFEEKMARMEDRE